MKFNFSTIIEKFNSLNEPLRYGIFGIVLVLVFLVDFFTLMGFQRFLLDGTGKRIEKLKADIAHIGNDKQRIGQMRQSLEKSRQDLENFNAKIRPLGEMPALLDDISRIATEAAVKVDQLTPLRDKLETLTKSDEVTYFGLPVVIEAHCGYHAFGHFLNALEKDNIFFSLKEMVMESDAKSGGALAVRAVLKVILVEKNEIENK